MTDATASEPQQAEALIPAAVFLSPEDFVVVQHLRQQYPNWRTEQVPHKACMAAVDLLFPVPGRKCGSSKGYRIQARTADAPAGLPAASTAPIPVVLAPAEAPADPTPATLSPAESGSEPPVDDVDEDAGRPDRAWPILLIAGSAFIAIWSGWVGLGEMTGFGLIKPFPGISDWEMNTAIALPVGVEAYAAYALRAWLTGRGSLKTRVFARNSAFGTLLLGALGQVAYHLLAAAGVRHAPWWVTTLVACLPVLCVGTGAALSHMISSDRKAYLLAQRRRQK